MPITRREFLHRGALGATSLSPLTRAALGSGLLGSAISAPATAQTPLRDPPYLLVEEDGDAIWQSASQYFPDPNNPTAVDGDNRGHRFPSGHRLAGQLRWRTNMEPLERTLLYLYVRCDYDVDRLYAQLQHGIRDLCLPYTSRHVHMTQGWLYRQPQANNGTAHTGTDFNNEPLARYRYPDHTERTSFDVVAVADGTIVGWDGYKLLTLEHEEPDGTPYRTVYNMMRDVPVDTNPSLAEIELGAPVTRGSRIGESWKPAKNVLHLHFHMYRLHRVSPGFRPDLGAVHDRLRDSFGIVLTPDQRQRVDDRLTRHRWPELEWHPVDPFGVYGMSSGKVRNNPPRPARPDYGLVFNGFYQPVPDGIGTYAFHDPHGDRIPQFAATDALLDDLSVQPVPLSIAASLYA